VTWESTQTLEEENTVYNHAYEQTGDCERQAALPRRARGGLGAATALLLGTLAAGPARADFVVSASAGVIVGQSPNEINQSVSTGLVQLPPAFASLSVNANTLNNVFSPNDVSSVTSRADFGRLGAFAIATEDDGVQIVGIANAFWVDTFIATSSDPNATQVTFQVTMSLFDTIAATNSTSGDAIANLILTDAAHINPVVLTSLDDDVHLPPLVSRTVTATFTEPVGAQFGLNGLLQVAAGASGTDLGLEGSITVDASDTAAFNLDVVTPGGGYTTESGVSYSTTSSPAAVPEPASLTLLGFGALGLLGYGWRRRRKPLAPSGEPTNCMFQDAVQ
jgi:hypothetical protein